MGKLSSSAQKLPRIITTSTNILQNQRIYMKIKENQVQGFIKVGHKNIFYRDFMGKIIEIDAFCVLDFYVHESCQRIGIGKQIYDAMLRGEHKKPKDIAIDAPSALFLKFMKKHFSLHKFTPQSSNFVFFEEYFDKEFDEKLGLNTQLRNPGFEYYRQQRPMRVRK